MVQEQKEYMCLINDEGQYSLWFTWKDIPSGWKQVGPEGEKSECLAYIEKVWTDIRPKSIQKRSKK